MTSRLLVLLLVIALSFTAGCASKRGKNKDDIDLSMGAPRLFDQGRKAMTGGNFAVAIRSFENVTATYPFSEEARQAQMDLLYLYLLIDEPESLVTAADRFILENPTHPRIDYALYMKGLARFPKEQSGLERLFRVNLDKRPPDRMREAFNIFQQLLQQHPHSEYAKDARQRMIYLRNRMAVHEIEVARFYLARDAHVAAINRARIVLEAYQETPSAVDALQIMARGYDGLGLHDLAAETRRILEANR